MKRREYESYDDYLAHQVHKTGRSQVRARVEARWERDVALFKKSFRPLADFVTPGSRGLCLGARLGCEVCVLRSLGYEAVGIDLVAAPPLVYVGDFHAIPFPDDYFSFAFSNSLDHVYDLDKFLAECQRVVHHGVLLFHVAVQHQRRYESLYIDSVDEVSDRLPGWIVAASRKAPDGTRSLLMKSP